MVSKDRTQEPNFDGLRLTMIAGLIEPYARCERPCARRRKAPLRSPCRTIRNNRRLKKLDSWMASIRHPLNHDCLLGGILSVRPKRILKEFCHRRINYKSAGLDCQRVKCTHLDLGHVLFLQRGKAMAQGLFKYTGLAGGG